MRIVIYICAILLMLNASLQATLAAGGHCSSGINLRTLLAPIARELRRSTAFLAGKEEAKVRVYRACIAQSNQATADRMLIDAQRFVEQFNRSAIYTGYLRRKNINIEHVAEIIADVHTFDVFWKQDFYVHYIESDTSAFFDIKMIFEDVFNFEKESYKATVYESFLKFESLDIADENKLFIDVESFEDDVEKCGIYVAYLSRENVISEYVEHILKQTQSFKNHFIKASLYNAYLKRKNIDLKLAGLVIEATKGMRDTEELKVFFYRKCLKEPDIDPGFKDVIVEDAASFVCEAYKAIVSDLLLKHRVG